VVLPVHIWDAGEAVNFGEKPAPGDDVVNALVRQGLGEVQPLNTI